MGLWRMSAGSATPCGRRAQCARRARSWSSSLRSALKFRFRPCRRAPGYRRRGFQIPLRLTLKSRQRRRWPAPRSGRPAVGSRRMVCGASPSTWRWLSGRSSHGLSSGGVSPLRSSTCTRQTWRSMQTTAEWSASSWDRRRCRRGPTPSRCSGRIRTTSRQSLRAAGVRSRRPRHHTERTASWVQSTRSRARGARAPSFRSSWTFGTMGRSSESRFGAKRSRSMTRSTSRW